MTDYISREALRRMMYAESFEKDSEYQRWDSGCWIRYKLFEHCVEAIPAADVAEVRHGEWEEVQYDEADGYYILYRCPHCGCERPKRDNYCKDCGAVMDGGQEE